MKFKLRHMEVFRAIMLTGSVSGAARMLFASQPAVSRMVAHVESTLGLVLFDRKNGLLKPTANAWILFREIDDLYRAATRIDGLVDKLKAAKQERISFCSSPALGISVIPKAIKRFQQKHKNLTFSYRTTTVKDMSADLLGKAVDFAISVWPVEHPNLACTRLFGGKICLIVPKKHPLARMDRVPLAALQDVPLIAYQQDMPMGEMARDMLTEAGINARPFIEINRSEQACSMVHHGLGVAFVNRYCVDEEIWSGLTVKEVELDLPAPVYLVTSSFESLSPDCLKFLKVLQSEYARLDEE